MSVLEAIYKRRAVRSYLAQPPDPETVRALLKAAVQAPTAVHEEPWAFVILENRDTLKRLSERAKDFLNEMARAIHLPGRDMSFHFTPPDNIFYDAPALIVIYGKPMGRFVEADCWLAAENLILAACAMGLGTCVIGLAVPALNTPEWKKELGVAAEMTAIAPIIVGIPKDTTPPVPRQEPQILSWK